MTLVAQILSVGTSLLRRLQHGTHSPKSLVALKAHLTIFLRLMRSPTFATYNRKRFIAELLPGSVALITYNCAQADAGASATSSRQFSDIYWLTGLAHEQACLLLFPEHPDESLREILFVPFPAEATEPAIALAEVAARTGIATVRWQTELLPSLGTMLPLATNIYLTTDEQRRPAENAEQTGVHDSVWWCLRNFPLHTYQRAAPLLRQLRQAKTPAELALIRRAAQFSSTGLQQAVHLLRTGSTLHEAVCGVEATYPADVAWVGQIRVVAPNGEKQKALSYRGAHETCQPGDVLLLTAAATCQQYQAGFTRTIAFDGHFTARQQEVAAAVERIYQQMLPAIRAGQYGFAVQQRYYELLVAELLQLKVVDAVAVQKHEAAHWAQTYGHFHLAEATGGTFPDASLHAVALPEKAVVCLEVGICLPEEQITMRVGNSMLLTKGPVELLPAAPTREKALEKWLQKAVPATAIASPAAAPFREKRTFWSYAYLLLLLPLFLDLGYSYVQHLNVPHDGDMVPIILPRSWYATVLEDPLGLKALLHGEQYVNPNRYFAHQAMYTYLRNAPLALQYFVDAIYSVYMASAIAKTFFQALIIAMLAYYISDRAAIYSKYFIVSALVITPFFQTAGYNDQIGIIDRSITYAFFYAFPAGLLLVYFIPIYKQLFSKQKKKISVGWHIALPILALVLALNGPLTPAIAGLMTIAILLYLTRHHFRRIPYLHASFKERIAMAYADIPKGIFWQLILFSLLSAYSLYIGTFNVDNVTEVRLGDLYAKLYEGLWYVLGQYAGFPVLLFSVIINLFILNKLPRTSQSHRIIVAAQWLLIFAVIYIALLPFGGYRTYRPYVIRRDTLIPVMLCLMYVFGASSLYILFYKKYRFRGYFITYLVGLAAFYSLNDLSNLRENNCEVDALRAIARSPEKTVHLEQACCVMEWGVITEPVKSTEQSKMLKFWRITKEEKLYYH